MNEHLCSSCRDAVIRTYGEMRACGRNDRAAFRAAVNVLALRHPERPFDTCLREAAGWIADAVER